MRVQNEDAVLFADVKRDVSLDRWRTMHEHLRMSVLHADRSMLLAAYCGMFRQLISELLQVTPILQVWFDRYPEVPSVLHMLVCVLSVATRLSGFVSCCQSSTRAVRYASSYTTELALYALPLPKIA